jgi:hypothetical protein
MTLSLSSFTNSDEQIEVDLKMDCMNLQHDVYAAYLSNGSTLDEAFDAAIAAYDGCVS